MAKDTVITDIVNEFAAKLVAAVEQQMVGRARAAFDVAIGGAAPAPKRRVNLAMRQQGQYMAALKPFKGKERERIRTLRREKGVQAALDLMSKLSARSN